MSEAQADPISTILARGAQGIDLTPEDYTQLTGALKDIRLEQDRGAWEPQAGETPELCAERVRLRVKRGIEITAVLRRVNTGVGKPAAARKRGKNSPEATQAALDALLE